MKLSTFVIIVLAIVCITQFTHYNGGDIKTTTTTVINHIDPVQYIAPVPIENLRTGCVTHTYKYTINGNKDQIVFTTYRGIYDIVQSPNSVTCYLNPGQTACTNDQVDLYYNNIINKRYQDVEINALTNVIKSKSTDLDTQVKIAISMVQNIQYSQMNKYVQDPYSVLYYNKGDCDDKAVLLSEILKDLNVGVVLLDYEKESHMAIGLKTNNPLYGYTFGGISYAFVETTQPNIITDRGFKFTDGTKITTIPNIRSINPSGIEITNLQNEYNDARSYRTVAGRDDLNKIEYNEYLRITDKYGL